MEITTRKQAIALGMKKYYTGVPCKYKHNTFRYTLTGACTGCIARYQRKIYDEIRIKNNEVKKGYIDVTVKCSVRNIKLVRRVARLLNSYAEEPKTFESALNAFTDNLSALEFCLTSGLL